MSESTPRSSDAAPALIAVTGATTVFDVSRHDEEIDQSYDLITCVDLLGRLSPTRSAEVVGRLCAATDQVAISTRDLDPGVTPPPGSAAPPVVAALFAEHGFLRRTDLDAALSSAGAVLFERADVDLREVVLRYETRLAALARPHEQQDRDGTDARQLQHQLLTMRDHVIGTEAEVGRLNRDLAVAISEARGATKRLKTVTARRDDLKTKLDGVRSTLADRNEQVSRLQARLAAPGVGSPEPQTGEPSLTHRAARRLLGRSR